MRCLLIAILFGLSLPAQAAATALTAGLPGIETTRPWLDQDPLVVQATSELAATRNEAGMLAASPNEWTLGYSSQRRDYGAGPKSTEPTLQLQRTFRFPGKGVLDRRLGAAGVSLAEARLREAYRMAARDLADLLIDWQAAGQLRVLLDQQVTAARKNLDAVKLRQRAGDAATMEVNAAEADFAETARRLSQAVSEEQLARINLLLRFPQADAISPALQEPGPIGESLDAWQARVLATSDPMRVAELEVARRDLAARRARADRLPDPTLGAFRSSEAFGDERIIGASISIPIPGRYRSQRLGQALSEADAARAAQNRQRQLVAADVARNHVEAAQGYERWRLAEDSAARTRVNADLTQRAYALGEVDLQTLLLARRQSSVAAESSLQARAAAVRASLRMAIDAHELWSP